MTSHACEFVTPLTFETVSGNPVVVDMFASPARWEVEHIAMAKRAELFIIAPATANVLAKLVAGIADDMLTSTVLATRAPLLVAPAMNTGMWENPATQRNMDTLLARGVRFVGPETGRLANGDMGNGRMAEPEEIVQAVCELLVTQRDYCGKRVLVTAGPTRERIDPVRYLTNRSSGKMGYAIASCAVARGASVTLVSGPTQLEPPKGVTLLSIESTMDLLETMSRHAPEHDVVIQAAAPADYRPAVPSSQKIRKQDHAPLNLELVETPDVAAAIGKQKRPGQVFVAFAAETENMIEHAREKLVRKHADLIVANDVTEPGSGFDVDTNRVTFITRETIQELPLMSKDAVAAALLDQVVKLIAET